MRPAIGGATVRLLPTDLAASRGRLHIVPASLVVASLTTRSVVATGFGLAGSLTWRLAHGSRLTRSRLDVAALAEHVDVSEQGDEGQHRHDEHRLRLGGRSEEQRATRDEREHEQHVCPATLLRITDAVGGTGRPLRMAAGARSGVIRVRRVSPTSTRRRLRCRGTNRCTTVGAASRAQSRATGCGGTAERRRSEGARHRAHRHATRRHGALQARQLIAEVRHRGVRTVLDPRTEQRRNEHCCPRCCYDEQDQLTHLFRSPLCREYVLACCARDATRQAFFTILRHCVTVRQRQRCPWTHHRHGPRRPRGGTRLIDRRSSPTAPARR